MVWIGVVALGIWLGLWLAHGAFWRVDREEMPAAPAEWPEVVAVIPARNEEAVIAETLRSLWAQDYPGRLRVVVVDDHSEDATAGAARAAAAQGGREADLTLLAAEPLPTGWAGKVWAMNQGVTRGIAPADSARYLLFSDADISHGPTALRELVCRAEAEGRDLVSFMVRLQCASLAERLMIPAFVFFFRMLYPFRRINNPADRMAGAAGGTMLVRRSALERIGGMAAIRGALIDDCALGAAVKQGGHSIWLGLSDTSVSTRGYGTLTEVLHMIARSAYTQLDYSPLKLIGCVLGLGLTFLAAPALALLAPGAAGWLGGLAWLLMALLYLPMLRFYHRRPFWAAALPLIALLYLWATLLSALRYHQGHGGAWKGRDQASPESRVESRE